MDIIKVMVVDDEEDFLLLIKLNLERTLEFKVDTVSTGLEAIKRAATFRPDIILLDVNMPELDGPAVLSKLSEDKITKDIPVVFLTALITKREEEEYKKRAGSRKYSYIAKPVDTEELISIIKDIVRA